MPLDAHEGESTSLSVGPSTTPLPVGLRRIPVNFPINIPLDSSTFTSVYQSMQREHTLLFPLHDKLARLKADIDASVVAYGRCPLDPPYFDLPTSWNYARLLQHAQETKNDIDTIGASIATHISLLSPSPIRLLPVEMLTEVFMHASNPFADATAFVGKDIRRHARLMSNILQVCKRWHHAALSNSRLWTTMSLILAPPNTAGSNPLGHPSLQERDYFWLRYQLRVERIQRHPIHLLFSISDKYSTSQYEETFRCLQNMFVMIPRASSIRLDLALKDSPARIESLAALECSPNMRAVEMYLCQEEPMMALPSAQNVAVASLILQKIPIVEELRIDATGQTLVNASIFSGRQLSVLDLRSGYIDINVLLAVLVSSPSLATLQLHRIWTNSVEPGQGVIEHLGVTEFLISDVRESQVFDYVSFPALESLRLATTACNPWPGRDVLQFLARSKCSLRHLELQDHTIRPGIVPDILVHHPRLEVLLLNATRHSSRGESGRWQWSCVPSRCQPLVPGVVIDSLVVDVESIITHLPALTKLGLSVDLENIPTVKRVLQSRWDASRSRCQHPTHLALVVNPESFDWTYVTQEIEAEFMSCRRGGLNLSVRLEDY